MINNATFRKPVFNSNQLRTAFSLVLNGTVVLTFLSWKFCHLFVEQFFRTNPYSFAMTVSQLQHARKKSLRKRLTCLSRQQAGQMVNTDLRYRRSIAFN